MKVSKWWIVPVIVASVVIGSRYVSVHEEKKGNEIDKNKDIVARITNDSTVISHHTLKLSNYDAHYVSSVNNEAKNASVDSVVFVHGTPGSWGTFSRYFEDKEFTQNIQLNSIDRPGWGLSTYPNKSFPIYLSEQSMLIEPVLEDIWLANNKKKLIVVGHSLGGSLVPKLAADYPHYIKGVIVLAGDLDPELSEARWFNFALDWVPSFLLPNMWKNSNDEVIAIQPSLESLQEEFARIIMPITVLQGTDDELVRPGSASKAPVIFKSSDVKVIMLKGASHIINLTHTEDVKKAIYEMAQKTQE